MEKQIPEKPMDQTQAKSSRRGKAPLAYILAAYAIWALIFYSLSPFSRSAPARLAARAIQVCEQTLR